MLINFYLTPLFIQPYFVSLFVVFLVVVFVYFNNPSSSFVSEKSVSIFILHNLQSLAVVNVVFFCFQIYNHDISVLVVSRWVSIKVLLNTIPMLVI